MEDKNQQILENFIHAKSFYDISRSFIDFITGKTSNFVDCKNEIEVFGYKVYQIGSIEVGRNEYIPIFIIELRELSERTSRKHQFELGKTILRGEYLYIAGIFIFYDKNGNKRISYIEKIYKDGKELYTTFKRYTFFISESQTNKTFLRQFASGDFTKQKSIREIFSVEKVTKQFYQEISSWYFWALSHVRFTDDAENEKNGREIGIIRFITRIIFVWFMREKGLVPKDLFDFNK
ncbi:MAG: hypothetical protein N3A71_02190 [Candidatus Dojkabacteria bacterium]|nr:hypothetical protein [Candidatus Dojkabacteria bacterium]